MARGGNVRPFEELTQAFAKGHSVDLRTIELRVLSKSSISAAIDTVMKAPEGRARHARPQCRPHGLWAS
jgi:hypothetical protein